MSQPYKFVKRPVSSYTRYAKSYTRKPRQRIVTTTSYSSKPRIYRGYPYGTKGELKNVDTTVAQVADTTGAVTLINGIARGDDINERVGRQVILKYIQANIVNYVTPTTGIDQSHRMLIVLDRQANGAAPAITDVLVSASTVAMPNLDNRKRFRILFDSIKNMNASGEPGSMIVQRVFKRVNIPVQFNSGDAGTVADIQTGALYLITLGSIAPGGTAGNFSGRIRVRYTDI